MTHITAGRDGALWFTEIGTGKIGRITTAGDVTEFDITTANMHPLSIACAPDGALWFTEANGTRGPAITQIRVGRITTAGVVTEYNPSGDPNLGPADITAGPDGNIWVTELPFASSATGAKIARIHA